MSDAQSRGWGSGWPNCAPEKMVSLAVGETSFGSVRHEIHDLLFLLLTEVEDRGYKLKAGQCFGYVCRPIKNPDGSLTDIPSNHSWGLAIDVNTLTNVFGGSSHDIPPWMVSLFRSYGFTWGGTWSNHDWEHFEFNGTPGQAKRYTDRARREFDVALTKDQESDLEYAGGLRHGLENELGKGEPQKDGPRREGWKHAQKILAAEAASKTPGT